MPYIRPELRPEYDPEIDQLILRLQDHGYNPGDLNYVLTRIAQGFARRHRSYGTFNEVMGVFSCVAQEFYRRVVVPYENEKIGEHGDV